ncbi:Ig-like domain-containing protein [Geomonas subterranea]|uniref:Ig-like domain-containing protein n=1 Tax=Geomonas subterranea TaxID=2847989 RepID=UPI001CD402DB|nr:Ig-like domain-containing protein [Geomonas fuzhouensis]
MRSFFRRALGQILVDGKFLSKGTLDRALEQQKQTHELLGAVLVRMGVLRPSDVDVPLMIQGHLSSMEDAVKLAAGQRQLLGSLLVLSGKITAAQLDHAIAEHQRTGERLGEVFIRLGMLTEIQLKGLLELQHNQESPASTPLRLGELLVSSGFITRQQLDLALAKQSRTGQKLGEVIVAEGFARRSQINHVVRLQKMCINSVLAAILSMGAMTASASASSVSLAWDPSSDATVVGYKVYYQPDSQTTPFQGPAPVDVQSLTAATIDNLDPSHSYSFAVTAYDVDGIESDYSNIVTVVESVPPATAITYPAPSATVAGTVTITADATDNIAVASVEFYVNGVLKGSAAAAPYVYSWDTASLAPGSYTLQTKAFDAAGNSALSQAISVTVANDVLAPTVSLASPANNMTVSGAVTVSANATDNVGVSRVEFYLNNTLLGATNVAPYSYTWDTRTMTNGVYSLTAKAFDAVGNAGQSQVVTVNVMNDLVAPTVNITSPASNATVTGTVTVAADATDNIGVSKVEFYRDGVLAATSAAAPYGYTWDTTQAANGSHTLTSRAYDAAGNVGQSQSVTVTVANTSSDLIAPTVSITSPAPNAIVSGKVAVTVNATDDVGVSKVEYYRNTTLIATIKSAPFTYSWDTTTVVDGNWTLSTKAYDAAGNVGQSQSVTVTVANTSSDLIAPTVSITSPAPNAIVSGKVAVTVNATDDVGVTKVEYYRNTTLIATIKSAPFTYSWDTTTVVDGNWTLSTKAYDAAGNVGQSQSVTVTVANTSSDLIAPAVSLTSPGSGSTVTGSVVISANASDNVGVSKVEFYRDGTLLSTLSASPYSYTWDTKTSTNGSHTLTAKAYDAAGNVGSSQNVSVTVQNDLQAPAVAITSPSNNATVSGTVTVSANASDNVGVTKVNFYRSGVLIATSTSAPYRFNWNTKTVPNGSYSLTATAYDAAGNTQSSQIAVNVKNK